MRCAISRRTPMTLTSVIPERGLSSAPAPPLPPFADGAAPFTAASKSFGVMRPLGPEPWTSRRSMPASRALRRVAGEALTLVTSPASAGTGLFTSPAAAVELAAIAGAEGRFTSPARGRGRTPCGCGLRILQSLSPTALPLAQARRRNSPVPPSGHGRRSSLDSVSNTTSSEPTRIRSPGWPLSATTRPVTGDGTSTAALSVMTSAMIWSSCTASPTLMCQATTSASTVPSPRSGILNT